MGIGLMVEVLDNAKAYRLSASEVRLLVSIAENANDGTRVGWPGRELLQHRMGQDSWDPVAKVLRSLARRGLDPRMPKGTDSTGRPLIAHRGSQTTYRVPNMAKQGAKQVASALPSKG